MDRSVPASSEQRSRPFALRSFVRTASLDLPENYCGQNFESVLASEIMFVSAEQLKQMQAKRDLLFCQQICAELRAQVPERTAPLNDDALVKVVAEAYTKSLSYGIITGGGVRRFIKLAVLVSPQFDEAPDVQRFLRMPDFDPDTKIKLLAQSVAQRLREVAA